jgi:hypothetical protein
LAKQYKIEVNAPKIDPKTESKVIVIRHGLSKMNFSYIEQDMTHKKDTPEYQALLSDPSLIDAELHPIGIQ